MKDRYGREIDYLRLSVTDRCNLRCRYCMPDEGVLKKRHEQMLTQDEMILAVTAAAQLGIKKVRITGGEPLVRKDIVEICRRTAEAEGIREVCLTTNGLLLDTLAEPLKKAGVSRINMSLDTLDAQKYARITRVGTLEGAMRGLQAAIDAGFERIKINAVLIGGFNDDEIVPLAELTRRYPVDMRFIELMPMVDSDEFGEDAYIPCTQVLEKLPDAVPVEHDGGVARLYRLPGARGCVGLISPVSDHFCGSCSRIRLTADGKLKPCLHAMEEISIKGMELEAMKTTMRQAIWEKPACHAVLSAQEHSMAGRSMNRIGG